MSVLEARPEAGPEENPNLLGPKFERFVRTQVRMISGISPQASPPIVGGPTPGRSHSVLRPSRGAHIQACGCVLCPRAEG
ncbi:hypothetical protein BD414DRAFT_483541 [Trametes punicea]|nr:hypothetical protein BD414DRAFT_483541 [Trametes punicea]